MDLRQEIDKYLEQKNLTAWRIKEGLEPNPFPIGNRNFYELYKGREVSKEKIALMRCFFMDLYLTESFNNYEDVYQKLKEHEENIQNTGEIIEKSKESNK